MAGARERVEASVLRLRKTVKGGRALQEALRVWRERGDETADARFSQGRVRGTQVAKDERSALLVTQERRRQQAPQKVANEKARAFSVKVARIGLRTCAGYQELGSELESRLAERLAAKVAPSTEQAYVNAFKRVQAWTELVSIPAMPMQEFGMCRYLYALGEVCRAKGLSRASVELACAAVRHMHGLAGQPSPTDTARVQTMRVAVGNMLGERGRQARPLEEDMIARIYAHVMTLSAADQAMMLATLTAIAVMREGVMRWDDGSRVEYKDVVWSPESAKIFLIEGKTDQRRKGRWVILIARAQAWSAYQLLKGMPGIFEGQWRAVTSLQQESWGVSHPKVVVQSRGELCLQLDRVRLCCPVQRVGGVFLPQNAEVRVTYPKFTLALQALVDAVGERGKDYVLHSMRRGGANALRQAGVAEEFIQQQGGWKQRETMLRYFDSAGELERRTQALRVVSERVRNVESEWDVSAVELAGWEQGV